MATRPQELRKRTKQFAIRIVRLVRQLPPTDDVRVMGKQLLRSGTAVAANYHAVCRARSKAEFLAKIGVVVDRDRRDRFLAGTLGRHGRRGGTADEGVASGSQ